MANPLDERLLALTALVTIGIQTTFFLISYVLKFDKVTDFAGTANFLAVAILTLTVSGGYTSRQVATTTCILIWGVRLCLFLVYRIILWGEDRRFDDKRENIGRLALFWIVQAVWVWTVCLPCTIVNSRDSTEGLRTLDYIGYAVFAGGVSLEAVADQQKLMYKQKPEARGRWIAVGAWAWSRHPNYFGEMAVWWGVYLSCVTELQGGEHAAVVSPVFITTLLLFVSGIPLLEQSADKRFAALDDYMAYKRRTSVLIPVPPMLYERLPRAIKTTLLLDFKLYNPGPQPQTDEEEGRANIDVG